MLYLLLATSVLVGDIPTAAPPASWPTNAGVIADGLRRLDEVALLGSHNTYNRGGQLTEALDHGVRAIEIDIWDDGDTNLVGLGDDEMHGDWYVRHLNDVFHGHNQNNCGLGNSNFGQCLDDLRAWHDRQPQHPLIVVFIDKKQGWGESRTPQDFDRLLLTRIDRRAFSAAAPLTGCANPPGHSLLVSPSLLKGDARTLREAAETKRLPTLTSLRGKFMFVLTQSSLDTYVAWQGAQACALVAPEIHHGQMRYDVVHGMPPAFGSRTQDWVIVYNIGFGELAQPQYPNDDTDLGWRMGEEIRRWHYLSRVFDIPDNVQAFRQARNDSPEPELKHGPTLGHNILAVDNYESMPLDVGGHSCDACEGRAWADTPLAAEKRPSQN